MNFLQKHFLPYKAADELWVLTVYYNPSGYKSRRENYEAFIQTMDTSGMNVLTVECAFGNDEFQLNHVQNVVQIRSKSLLWQKERLLNIGAQYLPESCKYVAWIDCDMVFRNTKWAVETCELLRNDFTIVQLFQNCIRLPKGNDPDGECDSAPSFSMVTSSDQKVLDQHRYDVHGHTGYAWAMRREIFDRVGLYEYAITGSADHYMAHAIYNHYGFCIQNAVKHDHKQIDHFRRWGERFHTEVQGKLGTVGGDVYHLWHGSLDRREYFDRMRKITEYGFDPKVDLIALPGKALEWNPEAIRDKKKLVDFFAEYFDSRKEDDA